MIQPSRSDPHAQTNRRKRIRRRMIATLPTMLTLGNLLCGFAAIFYASRSPDVQHMLPQFTPLMIAAGFIFIGMVFDALDGRVARMTHQTSDLGEQLDSMADMVCCGVAPAFLVIHLIGIGTPFFGAAAVDTLFDRLVLVVGGLYVACCGLRLARFNAEIDLPEEVDHSSFKGMPSPAAAGVVASLVLVHQKLTSEAIRVADGAPVTAETLKSAADAVAIGMVALTLLVAIAMVSNVRYTHFANRFLKGRAPFHMFAMVVILVGLMLIEPTITVAALFVIYAISGPVGLFWKKESTEPIEPEDDEADEIETAPTQDVESTP
jgi:CDP-diacylglycerol--serine O-phosphatidyltransferase